MYLDDLYLFRISKFEFRILKRMDPSKKNTYIIAAISLIVITAIVYFLFFFQKSPKEIKDEDQTEEVVQVAELEVAQRPYVTLTPTADGAEIVMSVENMDAFDKIEYELTYLADNPQVPGQKLQRGATGTDVNTKDPKYKKSILLGTASKGVRSIDTGIESGRLALHMFKGDKEYLSETEWDLFKIGLAKTNIKDSKGTFDLEVPQLNKTYWAILADTVGIPKSDEFDPNKVILPVWGTFSISPEFQQVANLKITAEVKEPKLYSFNHQDGTVEELESDFDEKTNTISAEVKNLATFIVSSE